MKFQIETVFSEALKEYTSGNYSQAREKCKTILEYNPAFGEAYNLLAVMAQRSQQEEQALQFFRLALKTNPGNCKYLNNIGSVLMKSGKLEEAENYFRKSVTTDKKFYPAYLSLAKLYRKQNKLEQAVENLQQLLSIKADHIPSLNLMANILVLQGKEEEALSVYLKALEIDPKLSELHYNIGNIYLKREELATAEISYRKSIELNPAFHLAWAALGQVHLRKHDYKNAKACFQKAIQLNPNNFEGWYGLATVAFQQGEEAEAKQYYEKSIQLNPGHEHAHFQLATILINLGFNEEAKKYLPYAIQLRNDFHEAIFSLAKIYSVENMLEESKELYQRLFELNTPNNATYYAEYCLLRMKNADWQNYEQLVEGLRQTVISLGDNDGKVTIPPPLTLNYFPIEPELHQKLADLYSSRLIQKANQLLQSSAFTYKEKKPGDKLRIGYISPDFRQHAVGLLLNRAFGYHDRTKVEVYIYHLVNYEDDYTRNFKEGADVYRNLSSLSFLNAAKAINEDGIDVLIDLAGYTTYSKPLILALKPAPVQIQFMGYPGTMGGGFISHILSDKWLITEEIKKYYSEQVLELPNAFFTSPIPVSDKKIERVSLGLPEKGVVFCCFNALYKISPEVFKAWMDILKQVEGSVLWLSDAIETSKNNLRKMAEGYGIDASRLVFARKLPMEDYMASYQCADLFLDTFHYSAGSTAVCALYGGIPVLTYAGNTNASRMGASISAAAGITETIATSPEEYIQKAVYYSRNISELNNLKERLRQKEGDLFNPAKSIQNLENELIKLVNQN